MVKLPQMLKNSILLISKITEKYGTVRRARGCFLYTQKNIRLTDMYQAGGRAILGWGSGSATTVFKNVLERKITGAFDTDFSPKADNEKSRLSKAVSELLGEIVTEENRGRVVFVFNSVGECKNSVEFVKEKFGIDAKKYIPWNQDGTDWRNEKAVIVEPTFAWDEDIFILALEENFFAELEKNESLYEKIISLVYRIPAPLCAAFTRAIYDLIKELQCREEKNWFIYDTVLTKYWVRKGPYLYPKVPLEKYQDFVLHCLENCLVISPDYDVPSIVPFGADFGNFTKLKKNPFEF